MSRRSFHDQLGGRRARDARRVPVLVLWTALVLGAALGLSGCGTQQQSEVADRWGASLHWPEQPGAESYRVQAWSDLRLLFEESSRDTTLALTPALRRALAPFETVQLQVFARDRRGEEFAEPWRGARP